MGRGRGGGGGGGGRGRGMGQLGAIAPRVVGPGATGAEASTPRETAPLPPKKLASTIAVIDKEQCTGCGLCVDACPEHAISLSVVATIQSDRCTGCGSCVSECPNEAISMSTSTPPGVVRAP